MGLVAVQQAARVSVISLSDQAWLDREEERLERRSLCQDRPNSVHVPLDLDKQHAAFVVVLIQPFGSSEWPGCTFFAVAIQEVHRCCPATNVQRLICEKVDRIIGHFYPQVTISVPQALLKTRFHALAESW